MNEPGGSGELLRPLHLRVHWPPLCCRCNLSPWTGKRAFCLEILVDIWNLKPSGPAGHCWLSLPLCYTCGHEFGGLGGLWRRTFQGDHKVAIIAGGFPVFSNKEYDLAFGALNPHLDRTLTLAGWF